jgi:peptidyl-prolyl cis-trans isomerase B (cyclophilin B)
VRRLLPLLLLLLVLSACGGDDDGGDTSAAPTTTAAGEPEPATGCRDVEQPEARTPPTLEQPSEILAEDKTYTAQVKTSCGDFTVTLDQKASPKAVASFVALAEADYFDGTVFHRIVPGFVIQGGDPTGTGTGGPGYSTRDVPPRDTTYLKGTVAMAKSAAEPPGTAGSQFYIVTAPDAGLPPEYALLGKVVSGQDVVDAIGQLGDPASGGEGVPLQPVVIESTELVER